MRLKSGSRKTAKPLTQLVIWGRRADLETKSMNLFGTQLEEPAITKTDRKDIRQVKIQPCSRKKHDRVND